MYSVTTFLLQTDKIIHFYVIGPKAAAFGRIMQNNGRYAIQDHLVSPI